MNAAFLQAAIPEPFTILGKRLHPFSLGHELILQRFENGFAVESKTLPKLDDLCFAVWICSKSYEEALRSLESRLTPMRLRFWGWRCGSAKLEEKFMLMLDYAAKAAEMPEIWLQDSHSGRQPGTPWVQTLIACASRQGFSYKEAMDMPYALVLWLFFGEAEKEKKVELFNDHDRKMKSLVNGSKS